MSRCLEGTRASSSWCTEVTGPVSCRAQKDRCVWDVEGLWRSGPEWRFVYQEKGFVQEDTRWL